MYSQIRTSRYDAISYSLCITFQAIILYDGYDVYEPDDVYLAEKPKFIKWFAIILFINATASGFSWFCYAIAPGKCHGLSFLLAIYIIDHFCDLFYTLFPLIVVWNDEYNRNTHGVGVLLGQLNEGTTSGQLFVASFLPLVKLSKKLGIYASKAQYELHQQYFARWMLYIHLKPTVNEFGGSETLKNRIVTPYKSWIDKDSIRGRMKQIFLIFIALMYIGFGISVCVYVTVYINDAKDYCDSVKESVWNFNGSDISISDEQREILNSNPELFVWDQCLYKVYPIVRNTGASRCQCRILWIDWDDLSSSSNDWEKLNLTQISILEGMLTHWTMLEKFRTTSLDQNEYELFNFTPNMFDSVHMKAFEWEYVQIESIPSEISRWKQLKHLRFGDVNDLTILPDELEHLSDLKSLSFEDFTMSSFPLFICNLTNLETLQMYYETQGIVSIPRCIENLHEMKVMLLDLIIYLENVPLSIFSLPNLRILSLSSSDMTYDSILEYNLPSNISANDTEAVDEWMESNFQYLDPNNTEYWISMSSICDENSTSFPTTFGEFVDMTCEHPANFTSTLCPPWALGDGML